MDPTSPPDTVVSPAAPVETIIVPDPPELQTARALIAERDARIATLEAQFAGADQAAAAAKLERDAARSALDVALREPCTTCGTQRVSSP